MLGINDYFVNMLTKYELEKMNRFKEYLGKILHFNENIPSNFL